MTDSISARGRFFRAPFGVPRSTLLFALALIALYAAILAVKFGLWRNNVLYSDWTFFNNILWNTDFRELWLYSHLAEQQYGFASYLNEHFSPILLALAPLYQIAPWPEHLLLALHGAAPVLAAIGIRATAVRLLGGRALAAVIGLAFAFNPAILQPAINSIYGFHTDCFLPPIAALAGWALAARRQGLYFFALLLALTVKENVPAYGVILGLCLIAFTARRAQGLWTVAISSAAFLLASKGVPWITGLESRNIGFVWKFLDDVLHLRATLDYTPSELIHAARYGLAFLPALFVLPFLAMLGPDILLIGQVSHATTSSWHIMLPVTVLGIASVYGTARFQALASSGALAGVDRLIPRARLIRLYWGAAMAAALIAGPADLWIKYGRWSAHGVQVDRVAVAAALELVPPAAGVVATNDIAQFFAHRKYLRSSLRKGEAVFGYLATNRHAVTLLRHHANDKCLIAMAEQLARRDGALLLDRGGILLVRLPAKAELECP